MKLKLAIITSALILSGCNAAMGVTNFAGEEQASKRAAFALGVSESQLTVSNVNKDGVRTEFQARTPTGSYNCYITNQIGITSDAICTPLNGAPAPAAMSKNCNALLKAAGKC